MAMFKVINTGIHHVHYAMHVE